MVQAKKDINKDKNAKKEKIVVEPDIRFPEDESKDKIKDKVEDKSVTEIRKFGDKRHKKSIRKENRLKFYHRSVNGARRTFAIEKMSVFAKSISRFMDYTFNVATIAAIIYCMYYGVVVSLPEDNWIGVACSGFFIAVLVWLNEKIS